MIVSVYSFVTTVIWFSAFILLSVFLQRKTGVVFSRRLMPLLVLLVLTFFRLLIPIETPYTQVICSDVIYPAIQKALRTSWLTLGRTQLTGTHILSAIWIIVAAILCVRLYLRMRRDYSLLKAVPAIQCHIAEQSLTQLLCRRKRAAKIQLIVSPSISTPMLIGLLHPCILLPPTVSTLSEFELKLILTHELTHLHNGDLWVKFLIRVLGCVMWWNPCIYLLTADLDNVLEYKCDLDATKNMPHSEKVQYLQTIVDILQQLEAQKSTISASALCFCRIPEKVILQRRFHLVLSEPKHNKHRASIALIFAFFMLFIFSYCVVLQPASAPPEDELYGETIVTPENSYILAAADGSYYLVHNGTKFGAIPEEILQDDPHCYLSIKKETT